MSNLNASHESEFTIAFKNRLAERIGRDRYGLWIGESAVWQVTADHVSITVENPFLADCIRNFCLEDVRAVGVEFFSTSPRIQIEGSKSDNRSSKKSDEQTDSKPSGDQQMSLFDADEELVTVSESTAPQAKTPGFPDHDSNVCNKSDSTEQRITDGENLQIRNPIPVKPREKMPAQQQKSAISTEPVYRKESKSLAPSNPLSKSTMMNPHDWSKFIAGKCNHLAYTTGEMIIEQPGRVSPLLLYGPTGCGKTHLAKAIAAMLKSAWQMRRVITVSAEQFLVDYTESAKGSGFASFRSKYRDINCLVIDDLQFLLGKGNTLIELRSTLEHLLGENKQIILTADRSLGELSGLGAELHTRLSGGMNCQLDALDDEVRKTLFTSFCDEQLLSISDDAIDAISSNCNGDGRALRGLALRLSAHQRSRFRDNEQPLSAAESLEVCGDLLRAAQPVIRIIDIERVITEAFGLSEEALRAKSKSKSIAQPRMLAMYLARKYTRAAYGEIGEHFGHRKHSTVISAEKKVSTWIDENSQIAHRRGNTSVREIMRSIKSTLKVS